MTTKQAIEILSEMNKWRRGEDKYGKAGAEMPYSPTEFGEAIDTAVNALSAIQQCYDNTCSVEHFLRKQGAFWDFQGQRKKTLIQKIKEYVCR